MTLLSPSSPTVAQVPLWQQRLLTALTLVILFLILWCNLPPGVSQSLKDWADKKLSRTMAHRVRYGEWLVRYTAHVAGLDSKWQMYGGQSRFNWRYVISAHYREGDRKSHRILPLPRQSQRSFVQRKFIDFKEAKFQLNIYNDPLARETYARYLARQYPEHQGMPIESIRYSLVVRHILPPLVAMKNQKLLEDIERSRVLDTFDVTPELARHVGRVASAD